MTIIQVIQQLRDDLKLWVANNLRTKVDKEDGKGLSSNDFTKADQDKLNEVDNKLSLTGGTMTGNIDMGNEAIVNIAAPTNNNDAATKKYVDDKIVVSDGVAPTSPFEGLIWIDTSVKSITSAEGASF